MNTATQEPPAVAKNKAKLPEPKPFILQLPPEYGPLLEAMKKETGRPKTVSAQMGIETVARIMGLKFKPNWPDLLGGSNGPS